MQVAQTILSQLGGNRFVVMTGAKNLTGRADGLSFKIGRNSHKVTHVRVTLNARDTYTCEFLNIRGTNIKTLQTVDDVYCEDLQRVFKAATGIHTHF